MTAQKQMSFPQIPMGEMERSREEFVRMMESLTPRQVLDAIEYVGVNTVPATSEWPEFVVQTHGACYAGPE